MKNVTKKELERIRRLLITIDVNNGFMKEGALADPSMMWIVDNLIRTAKQFQTDENRILMVNESHTKDSVEFDDFPPHCIEGTSEAEYIEELKPFLNNAILLPKNSTSFLVVPGVIEMMLQMINLEQIVVSGVCLDICDIDGIIPLKKLFQQYNRRVSFELPLDIVDTYDAPWHNKEEYKETALKLIKQASINVTDTYRR